MLNVILGSGSETPRYSKSDFGRLQSCIRLHDSLLHYISSCIASLAPSPEVTFLHSS